LLLIDHNMPPRKVKARIAADKYHYAAKKRVANAAKMRRQPFTERVKSVILRAQETKFVIRPPSNYNTNTTLQDFTAFTSGITSTNEIYGLIPDVSQGDDDFQRIGNVIQPTSLTVKVNVALNTTQTQSVYADVYFLHSKTVKDQSLVNGIQTAQLMNVGDGTNAPYDGTSYTAMLPINRSEFTVIAHKRILLQKGSNDPNTALTGTGSPATDTFSYTKSFSQKITLPKLQYENASKVQPSNTFPFMVVGFCGTDVNGNLAPISARVYVQAQSHLYFKDA